MTGLRRSTRTWLWLMQLSVAATLVGLADLPVLVTGALVLLAGFAKARLILLDYLGLRRVQGWPGGIMLVLGLYLIAMLGLYLAAGSVQAA